MFVADSEARYSFSSPSKKGRITAQFGPVEELEDGVDEDGCELEGGVDEDGCELEDGVDEDGCELEDGFDEDECELEDGFDEDGLEPEELDIGLDED